MVRHGSAIPASACLGNSGFAGNSGFSGAPGGPGYPEIPEIPTIPDISHRFCLRIPSFFEVASHERLDS